MTAREIDEAARVVLANVLINLMNDLPGFRELVDKACRKKGYSWPLEVDRFEKDVRDILEARLARTGDTSC